MSEFFLGLTVKDFPFDRQVVTIDSNTPVDKAFRLLVENHISAAPVWDGPNNKCVLLILVISVCAYMWIVSQEHVWT